jgi:hydroxyacylglutathione hydrolase
MIDVPYVRVLQGQDGRVTIPPEIHIAALDGPTYGFVTEPLTISRWIVPGTTVDLGGKQVQIISTPGHNDSEVVLYDLTDNVLLTGDHMYPGPLYDEKTELYSQSAAAVLKSINPTTQLYGAHGADTLMTYQDGADLDKTLRQIVNNEVQGTPLQRPDLTALEYVVNSTLRVWRYLKFAVGVDFGKS